MPITTSVQNIDQLLFPVCVGKSRMSKKWTNTTMSWADIVSRLSTTKRTNETMVEYLALSRDRQAEIKDKGGIVCGHLKADANSRQKDMAGRKTKDNILNRSILTFDIDSCPEGFNPIDVIDEQLPHVEAIAYTTHKHTPEHPRWRVFIPLSEWVTPFYYEAIARKVGSMIGMEMMDKTTFQYNRLMYWPSTPSDGEFLFDRAHGDPISPRAFLTEYPALKRESAWPRHPEEEPFPVQSPLTEREGEYNNVQRPAVATEKGGVVGAFLEAYPIEQAIATFLADVYIPCGLGRYTYVNGSSEGGLVIYDHQFAYSNHATDPANNGHDNNAFDLVRIHRFGNLDTGTHKTGANLPSFRAMCDFALEDTNVRSIIDAARAKELQDDFADLDFSDDDDDDEATPPVPSVATGSQAQQQQPQEEDTAWLSTLKVDRKGNIVDCNPNQDIILLNDPVFRLIRYDAFHRYNLMSKPALLKCSAKKMSDEMLRNITTRFYVKYGIDMSVNRAVEVLSGTQTRRAYNPVQDYITSVEWDGEKRIDTMLIRYLGADDTPLNREQTRRWMIGAVRRAFRPGSKFDYMLVLTGPQGIGKSTLLRTIAADGDFFNESLQLDMRGKDLVEQLNSAWIFEIAELGGLRSLKETDKVKAFISVTTDIMRAPYAHTTESYPRHCALAASTNDTTFLSDSNSRKFWIIPVVGAGTPEDWQDDLSHEVPQLWAEAYAAYKAGEPNFLSPEFEVQARAIQATFNTVTEDPATGIVGAYLDYLLPADWRSRSRDVRRAYLQTYDANDITQTLLRNRICAAEVRNEVKECITYSSQYINKILSSLGWTKHPSQKMTIDDAYGQQRNVFIRPDTDGSDTFVTPQSSAPANARYIKDYDDEDDEDL